MKYPKIIAVGLFLIFPFFFYGGPSYYSPRSYMAIWNLGHLLFFFLFVLFLHSKNSRGLSWSWAWRISCLVLVLGILIEFIQAGIDGRTPSGGDVVRDFMGAVLALMWLGWQHASRREKAGLLLVCLGISVWNIFPVGTAALDEWRAARDFPLLAGFENRYEVSRWLGDARKERSHAQARQGEFSLRISLSTATYSGVSLKYFPHDWRGFSFLAVSVFNDDTRPLAITIRVHDHKHAQSKQHYDDRFNRGFKLKHGWNDIKISLSEIRKAPKTRPMDMADIRGLGLFVIRQSNKKVIYLDDVRLVN